MRLGAETNTRWLWFITYILLPLNVLAQIFVLFWLLDADQGGIGILFILAELGLAIATIIGLHQFKPWGWYCIMVVFGIQLIGTPLKVHAKASMRYEVTQAANSYLQSQGRSPLTTSKPSIFDFGPMLTFVFLLAIWTIPNAIYLHRRRHLFGLETQSFPNPALDPMFPSKATSPMPRQSNSMMVSDEEERAYADARRELDSGNVREGLWAKVCAEETEDERRKAQYLRYRAQQIWYAKNTAETEARRKTTNASIRHWTWFVAKRIAAEVQGLIPSSHMPPPIPPQPLGLVVRQPSQNSLTTTATVGPLFGRTFLVAICQFLIVPVPWVATAFYKWFVERIQLPRREHLAFIGRPEDMWHVFMLSALCGYAGFLPVPFLPLLLTPLTAFLGLLLVRWFVSNLTADGRALPLRFSGAYWPYVGWTALGMVSFYTIVGWAWVYAAFMRWMCRNVEGTDTKIVFTGTGLEYLWRTVVFGLSAAVIIPIPWTYHWYVKWFMSRLSLEQR